MILLVLQLQVSKFETWKNLKNLESIFDFHFHEVWIATKGYLWQILTRKLIQNIHKRYKTKNGKIKVEKKTFIGIISIKLWHAGLIPKYSIKAFRPINIWCKCPHIYMSPCIKTNQMLPLVLIWWKNCP